MGTIDVSGYQSRGAHIQLGHGDGYLNRQHKELPWRTTGHRYAKQDVVRLGTNPMTSLTVDTVAGNVRKARSS